MPPQPQTSQGPADKVPCPFCQVPMDFTEFLDSDSGAGTLTQGARIDCDNPKCGKTSKVLLIKQITLVRLGPP